MTRRQSRENAVIALYQNTFKYEPLADLIADSLESENPLDAYGQKLLYAYEEHADTVDKLIEGNLKDWTLQRLPRVNAAILRLAVTEMLYAEEQEDIDSIVINEAVEIAKKYADETDYQYINGVLGSISRSKAAGDEENK